LGGGLGTTYDVHIGLIGKRAVDFLLVLIELVSLSVTVEAISFQREPVDPNFQVEGVAPPPTILFSEK